MDVGNTKVLHGELIASKEDCGYITYVFKNLDDCDVLHKYLMCVRFPNWDCPNIQVGDSGYIKYREVYAGIDKWYDPSVEEYVPYNFTDIHFLNFVYETKKDNLIL